MSRTDFFSLDEYHRRERVLDVATDLFAEYGYASVTTLQLSQELGCSETSLFNLFSTKNQIYETLFREWERTVQELPEIPIVDNSAIATLRKFFNTYRNRNVSIHRNMRPRLESAVYSRRTGGYTQRIHAVLKQQPDFVHGYLEPIIAFGQENGEIREGDPFELATLFWSILWGQIRLWYDADSQLPFQSIQYLFEKKQYDEMNSSSNVGSLRR